MGQYIREHMGSSYLDVKIGQIGVPCPGEGKYITVEKIGIFKPNGSTTRKGGTIIYMDSFTFINNFG